MSQKKRHPLFGKRARRRRIAAMMRVRHAVYSGWSDYWGIELLTYSQWLHPQMRRQYPPLTLADGGTS
jgi:hypothetical protein